MRADRSEPARSSDPYRDYRCPYCLEVRPVIRLNLDHQERCELRPTTEAG